MQPPLCAGWCVRALIGVQMTNVLVILEKPSRTRRHAEFTIPVYPVLNMAAIIILKYDENWQIQSLAYRAPPVVLYESNLPVSYAQFYRPSGSLFKLPLFN